MAQFMDGKQWLAARFLLGAGPGGRRSRVGRGGIRERDDRIIHPDPPKPLEAAVLVGAADEEDADRHQDEEKLHARARRVARVRGARASGAWVGVMLTPEMVEIAVSCGLESSRAKYSNSLRVSPGARGGSIGRDADGGDASS